MTINKQTEIIIQTNSRLILKNNKLLELSKDIEIVDEENGRVIMKLRSGEYQFYVKIK